MAISWIFRVLPMVDYANLGGLPRGCAPRNDVFSLCVDEKSPGSFDPGEIYYLMTVSTVPPQTVVKPSTS